MVIRRMLKITVLTLFLFFFTSPAVKDFITGEHEAGLAHDPLVKIEKFIRTHHPEISQEDLEEITMAVLDASAQYHIDYYLILSLIAAESSFRKTAVSHKGARGLTQLMPVNCYVRWRDIRPRLPGTGTCSSWNGLERSDRLGAYNAGPTRIARSKGGRGRPVYVKRVGHYQI